MRVYREERQRDVMVALDVSPSMFTGFQSRTKMEYGLELAATIAVSAVDAGDRLGLVLFADSVLTVLPARAGRAQLFRVLAALLEHTTPWQRPVCGTDPRVAIQAMQRQGRGRLAWSATSGRWSTG